ncbi:MAG: hypothetical protein HZB55_17665 [Deltaproteobacteria bacterium]|nr:hypothetical protein [Deltaproteobacteria bacterium]
MFPEAAARVVCLASTLLLTSSAWAAVPPAAGSPEAFDAEVGRYWSSFQGWWVPDLQTVIPEGALSRWTLRVTGDGTYSDNIDRTENPREAFLANGNVGLSWLRRSSRLDGSLEARHIEPLYRSDALEGRDLRSDALAAALRWQAARNLSLSGGGDVTRSAESGVDAAPEGVRSTYQNRFDNYAAHAEYSWRASQAVSNTSSYQFHYRHYRSDESEGEDTRSHVAATRLAVQFAPTDTLSGGYRYAREQTGGDANRTNHGADITWEHVLRFAPENPPQRVSLGYAVDRGNPSEGSDYWLHSATLGYSLPFSPTTDVGLRGGMQWLVPGHGEADRFWSWGADLSHRFTAYTTATLGVSQALEYALPSSRTERTELTDVRRVRAALDSQVARRWDGHLEGGYEEGYPKGESLDAAGSGDYWVGRGAGSLRVRLGQRSFALAEARLSRRNEDQTEDDYWLYGGGISFHAQFLEWLSGSVRYSHERQRMAAESDLASYRENRVEASVTFEW